MDNNNDYQDFAEKCRPLLIRHLVDPDSIAKANQVLKWIDPFKENCLVLSGPKGVGRHTIAEVACREIGCILQKLSVRLGETAISLSDRIHQLMNEFALRDHAADGKLVIVVDKCDYLPVHELRLLHDSIQTRCGPFPRVIFVVNRPAGDVVKALPNCTHIPVSNPSHLSIKNYLNAVSFMDGRAPNRDLDISFLKSYDRNIGKMIDNISEWSKKYREKMVVCFTGNSPAIMNVMKDLHEAGGRSQKKINRDVSLMVKEDDMSTNKRIQEAISKGIPVVTTKEFAGYMRIIKNFRNNDAYQEPMIVKEWDEALNQVFKRHHPMGSDRDKLPGSRKHKPKGHHTIIIIGAAWANYEQVHYSRSLGRPSGLYDILKKHPIEEQNFTHVKTPDVHIHDCCTSDVSLIGLFHPTKEVVMSSLEKLFQAKSQHKHVVFLGNLMDDGWYLCNGGSFVSGSEVAALLRSTVVPIIGGKTHLTVYPGLYFSDWHKFQFTNENINQILTTALIENKLEWRQMKRYHPEVNLIQLQKLCSFFAKDWFDSLLLKRK